MKQLFFVFALCLPAWSATYYVSQAGGTFSGGSACNGQTTQAYNWLSVGGHFTAGDTVYLCGTFSSELGIGNSGSSGNPVLIKFDTGAGISVPYCDTNGCLALLGNNYLIIDGGTPCGWNTQTNTSEGTCNGVIQATANGSSLANQHGGFGIPIGSSHDIEIKNLGIINMFVYVNGSGVFCTVGVASCPAIFTSQLANNVSIHDNLIHDCDWCVTVSGTSPSGLSVYNNQIYNFSHGITPASAASGGTFAVNIYGNYLHDQTWSNTGCAYHNDSIHLYGQSTSSLTAYTGSIYNNIFGGIGGGCFNAHIFMEATTTPGSAGLYIYNNLAYVTDQPPGGTGLIGLGPTPGSGTIYLYNNTVACDPPNGSPAGMLINLASFAFENNLVLGCNTLILETASSFTTIDHNGYATCTSGNCFKSGNNYDTFAQWQSAVSGDNNGQFTSGSANLTAAYVPLSNSLAVALGTNLTSLGITALNTDLGGVARPASGAWDAGAYQSNSALPVTDPAIGMFAKASP